MSRSCRPRFRSGRARAHIPACEPLTPTSRARGEHGSMALELVLVTPLVLVLVLFVAFCGRITRTQSIVRDAAAAGARAASLRQQPSAARSDAEAAVLASLAGHASACASSTVRVDTSLLRPGGQVSVEVSCSASLSDLALLGVPGSRTLTARSVEVVDRRRGG